ncbi:MAG: hypothetical protein HYT87_12985 [Nitrospirae bacterium]|nr:hypothetical protein [Nitrospirota bacterium]
MIRRNGEMAGVLPGGSSEQHILFCMKLAGSGRPIIQESHPAETLAELRERTGYGFCSGPNYWFGMALERGEWDEYGDFARCLESGRSYLYGNSVSPEAMARKKTALTREFALAARFCFDHPDVELSLEIRSGRSGNIVRDYRIRRRGEYVEIELPHHDAGGERGWITRDCKYRHLVNVD